ncbi:MAG: UPF0261 family protein [Firmicutes bacterium]|nr:UPF0261 family protein [Bacillota bacterium]
MCEKTQNKAVAVIATLDTKTEEVIYIRDLIKRQGYNAIVIDVGILGKPGVQPDFTREQIADMAGMSIEKVQSLSRIDAIAAMAAGLKGLLVDLYKSGKFSAAIGIGGATNCAIISPGLISLPLGVPKVLASPIASGETRMYVETSDMILIHSVIDIMGVNRVSRSIFNTAVGAAIGPLELDICAAENLDSKVVAITAFGVTTPATMMCEKLLKGYGYDVLVFSASGIGGMAMERLIREGLIDGVLDLTITELADELVGGVLSAGPDRMEAAGARGIPQVIVPGALDMVNFGPKSSIPSRFKDRLFYEHTPSVTLMRTNVEENRKLGAVVCEKLCRSKGPVRVIIPKRGFSKYDQEGGEFFDKAADNAFLEGLNNGIDCKIPIIECDAHINDEVFAVRAVKEFLEIAK